MAGTQILTIGILLVFSATFSLIEAAFLSTNAFKTEAFKKQKKWGAASLIRLKQRPRKTLITLLFCNTLINFTTVIIASNIASTYFPIKGAIIATIVMTVLVLMFGQIIPKIFAEQYAEKIILLLAKPTEVLAIMLSPITFFFEKMSERIPEKGTSVQEMSSEEFEAMLKSGQKGGVVSRKSAELIKNLIHFQTLIVREVVKPELQVTSLIENQKINDAIKVVLKNRHPQYPVLSKNLEDIIGIVKALDILEAKHKKKARQSIKSIMTKPFIIPETKNVEDLLVDMEEQNISVAAVVDEYGTFIGIVSVDDIIQQILKKITKLPEQQVLNRDRHAEYAGAIDIEKINQIYGTNISSNHQKTIAGLIEERLQRIPIVGEKIALGTLTIQILEADERGVRKVKIKKSK